MEQAIYKSNTLPVFKSEARKRKTKLKRAENIVEGILM